MLKKLPSTRLIFGYLQEVIGHMAGWCRPALRKLVQVHLAWVLPTGTLLQPEPWAAGVSKEAVQHRYRLYPADRYQIDTDGCAALCDITA